MTKLLLVCGYPGSGKTVLANGLSKKLGTVCLHKDTIKEALFDLLGCSTLKESQQAGLLSMKILFKLAEEQLSCGIDLIVDAPLYFQEDYKMFSVWEKKYDLDIYKIICKTEEEERRKRYLRRAKKSHPAHFYEERADEYAFKKSDYSIYELMPGKKIETLTNQRVDILVNSVIKKLNK